MALSLMGIAVIERLSGHIQRSYHYAFSQWLGRRIPPTRELTLNSKTLFIFPTRAGFAWLVLLILTWLAATNYENNLVFAFACLLTSLFVISILATFTTLSGLTVKYVRAMPAFAREEAIVEIVLCQQQSRIRENIECSFPGSEKVGTTLFGEEELRLQIPVPAPKRGWLKPGRLLIESVYPLGLIRVWSKLDLAIECLVYPYPVHDVPLSFTSLGKGSGPLQSNEGTEDFVGLKTYQPGDSLKRVAWKQYAREQGMHAKHYADPQDQELWLDWAAFPDHHKEARLSRLCGWLLEVAATQHRYGLRLPGQEIPPDRGEQHRQSVLKALALFEVAYSQPKPKPKLKPTPGASAKAIQQGKS